MSTADLHTLTGAYAVHALSVDEREAFERHVGSCDPCAQEVRELSATADRLALAVARVAAPELRARVLRRITTVRQEAPDVPVRSRRGRLGRFASWSLPHLALAASLVVAAVGGVALWQNQEARDARHEVQQVRARTDAVSRVLSAPDAVSRPAGLGGGARGTVVVSRGEDKAVFVAHGMRRLSGGKVYQLWFDDGGRMRSAGLMDASRGATDAALMELMEGKVGRASGMGVTVEPAGGSDRPTSRPLALVAFPSA
ncbi:anti-sigma factor [Streptomyces sp. NPDC047108]|uniref:anti-sigma factor n=1 Tax=Streptomyces sp. NPDC047108 TaxID=3155025 RepID=UPI0034048349